MNGVKMFGLVAAILALTLAMAAPAIAHDHGWNRGGCNDFWRGYQYGYSNGYYNGYNNGYYNGYSNGYYNGYGNGYYNGYNNGYNSAYYGRRWYGGYGRDRSLWGW